MDMTVDQSEPGLTVVGLSGRLDIEGAAAIDMRFSLLAGAAKHVIVDMSQVSFVASMGLRTLMTAARTVTMRGGKMAIFGADANVEKVLTMSGADEVIALADTREAAIDAISA